MLKRTTVGRIEVRSVEGKPTEMEGLAVPYGVTIKAGYGNERFIRGAFSEMVKAVNSGERLAYLNRHGEDGGVPVASIDRLQERSEGLWFHALPLDEDMPEFVQSRREVSAGINGVSIEFVPGKYRRKGDVVEHYDGARLAAIAGAYAPAYKSARVALRSVAGATGRLGPVKLTTAALLERKATLETQVATIRSVAETENRSLDDAETEEVGVINGRIQNVDALIVSAKADDERRSAERNALPAGPANTKAPGIVTRAESVYGPGTERSFFGDLIAMSRSSEAAERMTRHKALVTDLAHQVETRAVDSADLAGAYPTGYFPDLYVPDIAYTGPLAAFFATTPITAPNPIIVPAFASVAGDTDVQAAENTPVANVDVTTEPKTLTPKTIGGESIVSRQAVDGASPGTDVIIGNQLRELLMRDTEREIALVLEALVEAGTITDHASIAAALSAYYAGAAAGGAGARMLPAEGTFLNSTLWGALTAEVDGNGRPLLPYINPTNALGTVQGVGFQKGVIGGVPVEPAWAILDAATSIIARRNDARQWKSAVLDVRYLEREGPQSVVFAIWQYFGFAVLEPKGVRKYGDGLP